jgi:mono/diheme cytochrome c family protein
MEIRLKPIIPATVLASLMLSGCVTNPDSSGLEFMPDMYRSAAVEAYVDYGMEPFMVGEDVAAAQRLVASARKPVAGSIAFAGDDMVYALPYAYANTPEGYEAAGAALTSPLATTEANILKGQEIYERMCSQCHGIEGSGDGALSVNGHIQGIPSYSEKLKDLPEGKMFHTLTHGKGLMGSHASQVSIKERWLVIEYIKVLQSGGEMPTFDEDGNVVEPVEGAEGAEATSMNS